jgi:hypothetical protein
MNETRWELLDHACRLCHGRLLRTQAENGAWIVRCAECETEVTGSHEQLCACGAKLRNGRLAGLKCKVNPSITIDQPARIIIVYEGEQKCPG